LLSIIYNSKVLDDFDIINDSIPETEEISKLFEARLEKRKQEEIIRGTALVGPHRDDISFFINNIEAKKYASQGQQRTIVLSLKLSELLLIENKINEKPILLLDDVLAELDDIRQGYLLDAIGSNIQTIITSVDTLQFKESYLQKVDILKIKEGKLLD
jgi:DNA replication and repair protein RecF